MTRFTSYFILCALLVVGAITLSFAQTVSPQPMITQRVDSSQLVTLKGNVHPLAQSLTDLGVASPNLVMHRMLLVLNHSSAQESALNRLIDEQQEKESPNYHQWLTPEQFGQQFGASMQDIQTIASWLQSNGFQVMQVSKGRNVIEFSGTAGQVAQAFHTSIHSYLGSDGPHWANASDPQIPAALAPAIAGIDSLNNFPRTAAHEFYGVYSHQDHKLTSAPQFTILGGGCDQDNNCYAVSPYDFATIYNVLPLWTAGTDGTGETIAVVGRSNVNPQDVNTFRSLFDLPPADSQHFQVILNGPDPGLADDESEADIDVQWAGAVAKNAKIDFVVSQSTETTDGVDLSAFYIIDNNLAPILSESFGQCELFLGTAGNSFYNALWQQAAAQGISVFLSTGDNGAAGCDNNLGTVPQPATEGLAVSGLASTSYNVAVGGTDFNDFSNPLTYWSSTNDLMTNASALSYIPETTWNDSCTSALFPALSGYSTNLETNCNDPRLTSIVWTVGASGGASNCTASDGSSPSSCTGGHPKPSWQTGAGVPNDGKRDIPDVSLFASNGFVGNFYVICESDITNGFCSLSNLAGFGGTSVSTPAFAGIMALVDQTMGGRQGNPNYVLYKLASSTPSAFHDVPSGSTIAMPCQKGSPNCTVNTSGHTYGVQSGYATGANYDLATGLGSVNANALVTDWNSVTFKSSATTMTAPTPTSITHGQQVSTTISVAAVAPATGTPTGDVSLITSTGQSVGGFTLSNGSVNATTSLLPGGNYTISAHYAGDGTFGGSDSAPSPSITVAPEGSKTFADLVTFDNNGNLLSFNATSATYGSGFYLLRFDVGDSAATFSPTSGISSNCSNRVASCPTGPITVGLNATPINLSLNGAGYAEELSLGAGNYTVSASYPGDASYGPSTGTTNFTIAKATTTTQAGVSDTSPQYGNRTEIVTEVDTTSNGAEPSCAFTFIVNGSAISNSNPLVCNGTASTNGGFAVASTSIVNPFLIIGNNTVVVQYLGDANYAPSTSPIISVQVSKANIDFSSYGTASPININQQVTITASLFGSAAGAAPTGTVTFFDNGSVIPGTVTYTSQPAAPLVVSSFSATIPYTTNVPGLHNLTMSYSGDGNYLSTTTPIPDQLTVIGPFSITAGNPSIVVAGPGQSATTPLTISPNGGFIGTVTLSCTADPNANEAGCGFQTGSSTSSTLEVSLNGSSASGTFVVTTTAPHPKSSVRHGTMGFFAGFIFLGLIVTTIPTERFRRSNRFLVIMVVILLGSLGSCGGGSSSGGGSGGGGTNPNNDPGTVAGGYTFTVTGVTGSGSTTISEPISIHVTVQ